MQQYQDELGLHYSAGEPESVDTFNAVIEDYLASRHTVMPALETLLEADPSMPLALCFRAYLLKLAADPRFSAPIRQILARLEKDVDHLNARERRHVLALRAWADDDLDTTTRIFEDILRDHPKDMLALRVAHYLHFYSGIAENMRDSVDRAVAIWSEHDPFYGYLLGMHSFGLEESGDYDRAESAGRRAVALNADDIWAAHAVTHVFQMQSRFDEGIPWVASLLPGWRDANNFIYHMHWHKALCHIGVGDLDAALDIYDAELEGALTDDFYLDVCNAASLLWRLEMLGKDVGSRWQSLREFANARVTDNELIFSTLHYLMPAVRLQDREAISKGVDHIRHWADTASTQGMVCKTVGLTIAEALADIGAGEHERAARSLSNVSDKIRLIGGSHAQRDLFNQLRDYSMAMTS